MKLVVVAVAAAGLLVGGIARAEISDQRDRFMKDPPKETVYATDQHMTFSVRTAIIHWLGGVTVVKENDLRAAKRDGWWGADVPLLRSESGREPATR